MPKAAVRRASVAACLVAAAVVASCNEQPTAPAAPPPSLNLTPPAPPPAPGRLTGSISPASSNVSVGPIGFGSFADTTYVEVSTVSSVLVYDGPSFGGGYLGTRGPGETYSSTYGCWNYPYFQSAYTTNLVSHCPAVFGTSKELTKTLKTTMYGAVTARWKGKNWANTSRTCDVSGAPACYRYTGAYNVTITPSFNTLRLTASSSSVLVGDSVTFTASRSPTGALTLRDWTWVPDDSTIARSNPCGTANPCRFAVPNSGTMYVRAKVSGALEQQKKAVTATRPDLELAVNQSVVVPGGDAVFTAFTTPTDTFSVQSWTWIPDDTTVAASNVACSGVSCQHTIPANGRMVVAALVRGSLDSATQAMSVAPPVLDVQCPPSVPRGGGITCSATVSPAVAFTITEWRSSASVNGIPWTAAGPSPQAKSAGQAAGWGGRIVVDGTNISARATVTVGGTTWSDLQDAAAVTVTARQWVLLLDTISIDSSKNLGKRPEIECESQSHHVTGRHGWTVVPGVQNCQRGGLLDPWPADSGAGVTLTEITDGGPNQTLWFVDSLKTAVRVRMQVLRDFRADAEKNLTIIGDSMYTDCWTANANRTDGRVTIGVADSVCKGSSGFKHRVDSLWGHERCHQLRLVEKVKEPYSTIRVDSLERLVRPAEAEMEEDRFRYLVGITIYANQYAKAIDEVPLQQWPTYWGLHDTIPGVWLQRRDSAYASQVCP